VCCALFSVLAGLLVASTAHECCEPRVRVKLEQNKALIVL